MQALIHIKVENEPTGYYSHPVIQWAKEEFADLVTYDFDNFSEPSIINYGIDLIKQVDKAFIIINANAEGNAGPLIKFMESLLRAKKPLIVVLNGENQMLKKMAQALGDAHFLLDKSLEEQKTMIKNYFI